MEFIRTTSEHPAFVKLVHALDQYLAIRNGEDNAFFVQFNRIDLIHHVILVIDQEIPVGCGAMKEIGTGVMEIKRMFVPSEFRGKGIATKVLIELENWAKEIGVNTTVLETGKDMVDAVGLYQKSGYQIIPNYGPYKEVETNVCFEKQLA